MPPEGIDSLNTDTLKSLVLSLVARIDELFEQNSALLALSRHAHWAHLHVLTPGKAPLLAHHPGGERVG